MSEGQQQKVCLLTNNSLGFRQTWIPIEPYEQCCELSCGLLNWVCFIVRKTGLPCLTYSTVETRERLDANGGALNSDAWSLRQNRLDGLRGLHEYKPEAAGTQVKF